MSAVAHPWICSRHGVMTTNLIGKKKSFIQICIYWSLVITNVDSVERCGNVCIPVIQVLVSLNMCMVVGLTVDYVVHLAEGYTLSLHRDRLSRVRDMLDEMAISVFFGACTTLGASMFMFLAQLSFFLQFGIFMFSTIGFSLFFSMGMFVTLMGLVGPQGDTGNIVAMFKKVKGWCKSRSAQSNVSDKRTDDIHSGESPWVSLHCLHITQWQTLQI